MHFLVNELNILKDSRIGKIYHPEINLIIFNLYKTNIGKKLLCINVGKTVFLGEKEDYGKILGFGQLLRKHLDGLFLVGITQLKPERILKLSFESKESKKSLCIEFFGKGNAILCDEHNVIINALEHHDFRERSVKPRLKYVYPVMSFNLFDIDKKRLEDMLKNSKKESVVISLATELGLGGVYSEEICLSSNIDKLLNPQNINAKQIQSILDSIKKIIGKKINAEVIFDENNKVIDATPFELQFHEKNKKQKFETFNEALQFFYSHFKEEKETAFDSRLKELQRIIEQQNATIESLKTEEKELREKGELIYHKYALIKEILDEITKASKKYSWKEIKEKLKGHKIIKELNEKDRKIVVEV